MYFLAHRARGSAALLLVASLAASCSGPPAARAPTPEAAVSAPVPGTPPVASPTDVSPSSPSGPSPTPPAPASSPTEPPVPRDAPTLAAELVAVERRIRAPDAPPSEYASLGRRQQAAYRRVVGEGWQSIVLSAAPPDLRGVVEANITAGAELRALTRPVPSLPAWRIVPPPPAAELLAHYREAERVHGVPWPYLAAIHLVESRMGRIRGTSPAGARGPMQFLPATWARYGQGNIEDPRDSILAAGRYLRANGAPAEMERALYRYNPSRRYVRAITLYARQMMASERAYLAYYHWQVYVRTTSGDVLLKEGYGS